NQATTSKLATITLLHLETVREIQIKIKMVSSETSGMIFFLICVCFFNELTAVEVNYKPTWDSLDSRPLPLWFDESKVGIFIHWGVFSVPSFGSEWFWFEWKGYKKQEYVDFMRENFKPNFTYAEFAPQFTAEFFHPDHWAKLFAQSGAKYVVLTSKHHEGYTLWPSKTSWNWNSVDVGPKRDLLGELASAVRKVGLRFGAYHSLYEWFNPLYLQDKNNSFNTQYFVNVRHFLVFSFYLIECAFKFKTMPELRDLVNTYKVEIIWSDGDWEASDDYWQSKEFLAWLYNESPVKETVVVNDRWGKNIPCKHGGYFTCQDRFNPGKLQKRKWENAMTLDKGSWGFNRLRTVEDYLTIKELLTTLAQTISFGGNLLINVGPTHDGRIDPIMEERLLQLGEWLLINGDAIYKTEPWKYQNDTKTHKVWYTAAKQNDLVYAIFFDWPDNGILKLASIKGSKDKSVICLITNKGEVQLKWKESNGTEISLPPRPLTKWAWVLRLKNIDPAVNHTWG
ncbi:alpha-L-fucosidase-like protein, partial [Dinothrombium tinctorium]